MTIADTSTTRLAYVVEATEGTTPATPSFQTLRYKSESLTAPIETIQSDEIRADRNSTDEITVGEMVSGSIAGELSYGTYDDIFEGLFCGAWSTNVLKNGVARKAFTFEKTFEQGATDSFLRYRGCLISSATISLKPKSIAEISFEVMGRGGDDGDDAIISGATYAAATTAPVLNAASHVGALSIAGLSGNPVWTSLEITISNNLYEQPQIGSRELAGIGLGRFDVTVSGEIYFEDIEVYNAIRAGTTAALTTTIGAASGSKYTLSIPSLRLLSGSPETPGNNQSAVLPFTGRGIYNASDAASIKLTRAVS